MLASYDKNNGFGGLISSIKKIKELPPITEEIKNGITELFNLNASDNLDAWIGKFDKLADSCGVTDKTFTEFLKTTQESGTVYKNAEEAIAGYQTYLKTIGKQLDLANFKTKVWSLSMKDVIFYWIKEYREIYFNSKIHFCVFFRMKIMFDKYMYSCYHPIKI